jgi:hypothetical protein
MPLARSNFRYTPAIASQSFAFGGRGLNPYVGVRPNYRYTSSIAARSFAVGGRGLNPYVGVRPNYRNYSYGNRFANGALPFATYRYWDRHHDHEWNHHHYRGAGNSWVIIDGGYGYPYGYPYYYDDGYYSAPYVTSPPVYNTPDVGPTDSLGAEVQQALADQGYYHDAIDGDVGPMTRDAIAAYQRDHQLPVTGTITAPLLDSLGLN